MKARGRSTPFGRKITRALIAASGIGVLTVSVLATAAGYADLRRDTVAAVNSQAAVLSLNSSAALVFGDREHGNDSLGVLRAQPDFAAATLFARDGQEFASYVRAADPPPAIRLESTGLERQGRWLVLAAPVVDRGEKQGTLLLVYDLQRVQRRLATSLLVSFLVACGAMLLAALVARPIKQNLVRPIDALVSTANQVSRTGDYSLRAKRYGDDEIGEFATAFNDMLTQIQSQDRDLQASQVEREALLESERAARGEAERASRTKDEFLATLSHELRTPLMPILGWIEILRQSGPKDPDTTKALEVIERNARLQTHMIGDLLDMSRIISGKLQLDLGPVDLPLVIDSAIATVKPVAEARDVHLTVSTDMSPRVVLGDANRLQQVVWNLLSNAVKFTPKGGLVRLSLVRTEDRAVLTVSDSGEGIEAEFLPHIFERFRQADGSIARRHGGLGLGLGIVRQLVELHGGTVRAESPGRDAGATLTVSLPLAAEPTDGGHAPPDVEPGD